MRTPEFHYTNKAGSTPELFIYDEIGPAWAGMVSGKSVAQALTEIGKAKELVVHINSPGGDVFEGVAIYNLLNGLKDTTVKMQVDGLAASAASLVLMAGDEIAMASNAFAMIHNVWTITLGDANSLRNTANRLEQFDAQLRATYVAATGLTDDEIKAMMDAETWLSAEDAVAKGFADSILPAAQLRASISKDRYRNTPTIFLSDAADTSTTPAPTTTLEPADGTTTPEPVVIETDVLACPKRSYAKLIATLEHALAG